MIWKRQRKCFICNCDVGLGKEAVPAVKGPFGSRCWRLSEAPQWVFPYSCCACTQFCHLIFIVTLSLSHFFSNIYFHFHTLPVGSRCWRLSEALQWGFPLCLIGNVNQLWKQREDSHQFPFLEIKPNQYLSVTGRLYVQVSEEKIPG